MKTTLAIAAILSMSATFARAEIVAIYTSAEQLTRTCRAYLQLAKANNRTNNSQEAYDAGFCLGAVYLVMDAQAMHATEIEYSEFVPKFCVPHSAIGTDVAEVVANYIDAHPELRTLGGYFLIRRALADAWPCG